MQKQVVRILAFAALLFAGHAKRIRTQEALAADSQPVVQWLAGKVIKTIAKEIVMANVKSLNADGSVAVINLDKSGDATYLRLVSSAGIAGPFNVGKNYNETQRPKQMAVGAATMMQASGDTAEVQVWSDYKVKKQFTCVGKIRPGCKKRQVASRYYAGPKKCENERLQVGQVFLYKGGCTFQSLQGWDPTDIGTLEHSLCNHFDGAEKTQCIGYILCALDNIFFWPMPTEFAGKHHILSAQSECPGAFTQDVDKATGAVSINWLKKRQGFLNDWRGGKEWECRTRGSSKGDSCKGDCNLCGTEGLCCRYPWNTVAGANVPFSYTGERAKHGCGNKGCYNYHCCVRK